MYQLRVRTVGTSFVQHGLVAQKMHYNKIPLKNIFCMFCGNGKVLCLLPVLLQTLNALSM